MPEISKIQLSYADNMHPIGPKTAAGQLVLPEVVIASVKYSDGSSAEFVYKLREQQLRLISLFMNNEAEGINSVDTTRIKLPAVAKRVVQEINAGVISKLSVETKEGLAQSYWSEYICGGAPRQLIMKMKGWSRSNANHHIKKLASVGLVPADRGN
jgi:predicted transcriptional regulator